MGQEKKVYSFRFEESMVKDLQYYATRENRSLSNFVETILKSYLSVMKSRSRSKSKSKEK